MAESHQELSQSPQRTVIVSVALVGVLGALATVFDYLHLQAAHRLGDYTQFSVIAIAIFLPCMVALVLFTRGRYLRQAVWAVFLFGSVHLLTFIFQALFFHNDTSVAVEHGIWILVVEVCLFATLKRQIALVLSTILYGAMLTIIGSFMIFQEIESIHASGEGELVQLLIGNAAILVLLGGLSSFREFALVESARASASEENAVLLEANAELANAERKKAIQALNSAEAAAKARESFLASMSHELRTPLNAIIGFAQILEMDDFGAASPAAKRQEYATDIRNSGEHMLGLIGQILEYSRLESEGAEVNKTPQAVAQIADASLRMVDVLAKAKDIHLTRSWDFGDDYVVRTDEKALSQILVNLLSNAVKFTPKGGAIRVTITRARNGAVTIEVSDTGAGIPDDQIALVCDPFFQVGDQQTTGTDGTGLGLSIVKTLTAALDGCLEIESIMGEGTCCRVRIPSTPDLEIAAEETDKQAAAPYAKAAS